MSQANVRSTTQHGCELLVDGVCSQIGGWHDFRHTLSRTLRRAGVHPVVVKDTLGHSKVDLAMNVYDKASPDDIRAGLRVISNKLLGSDLLPKNLLPATPKQPDGNEGAA